jgi:hypothetical protein
MALDLVSDYLTASRIILQDEVTPYRYSDASLILALNLGLLETRRIRPDIFLKVATVPTYTTTTQTVAFDPQYRVALLYYICGQAQLRDDEQTQDTRAAIFMNKFTSQLLTYAA